MDRRKLIKLLSVGAAATSVSTGFTALVSATEKTHKAHWGYIGENGPNRWAELSPEFQVCQMGSEQSPINLDRAIKADLTTLEFNYNPIPLKILHNGHTIQVNCAPGNTLILDGKTFHLAQFHFHHPSEHLVTGKAFPMELHLVHRSDAGELAVVGVFLQQGQENTTLRALWEAMPRQTGPEKVVPGVTIDLSQLLPPKRIFERYAGSLTTPPCSEGVNWIVMKQPIEVSSAQIQQFAQVIGQNARPVQALKRRFLLESH